MTSERDWRGFLFVAPFLLLYSIILIFPLLRGMWLSLNQVDLFGRTITFDCSTIPFSAPRSSIRSRSR